MAQTGLTGVERELGQYPERFEASKGVLLVVLCGLHGNEPAGVLAADRVLEELQALRPTCGGQLVALCGNVSALRAGVRFAKRDLNRIWTNEEITSLEDGADLGPESQEMRELLGILRPLLSAGWKRIALLDLHSTSAAGPPSLICADTLSNRPVARALGIPVLLGLEETLPGTLLSFFSEHGHTALCVEGGQNDHPSTVDHHEATIWLSMASLGLLGDQALPQLERSRACLASNWEGQFNFIEVVYRQEVREDQGFWMERGFTHCHHVSQGRLLAHIERDGVREPLLAPTDGVLLMPRYQGQGTDGYFIGRLVRPRWLWLSALLRRLPVHWVLRCFDAVKYDATDRLHLRVDGRRLGPVLSDLLGLFGYRKCSTAGDWLTYLRRPQ